MKKTVLVLILAGLARADGLQSETQTPIRHVVVIFNENISFDHYFGTYPNASPNLDGSVYFGKPKAATPGINGYVPTLLTRNPNLYTGGSNPFRLDRSQAATCNNSNNYTTGQQAFDGGLMDRYALTSRVTPCGFFLPPPGQFLSMGYYDGNTVTALWNYAQNFAISDNFFDTEFGGTVAGHMNLLSGQTNGLEVLTGTYAAPIVGSSDIPATIVNGSIIANVNPFYDDCGGTAPNVAMTGQNIGNLLNASGISWGWFYGDFSPVTITNGRATCVAQYNPHYAPLSYYRSTANPHHLPPVSLAAVGKDTCSDFSCANHNYDLSVFYNALAAGNLPAVTYLKFRENDTGHPADSTPLLEQTAIVTAVNAIGKSPFWRDTAIIIAYDDSGGWYDQVAGPVINQSTDGNNDAIFGNPKAGTGSCASPGVSLPAGALNDRCGFGARLPLVVISPFSKSNYVDHSLNDITSILRFVEYNWNLGNLGDPQSFDVLASGSILRMFDFQASNRPLILDPSTGKPVTSPEDDIKAGP